MTRRAASTILFSAFILLGSWLSAQTTKTLPTDPTEFIDEFCSRLDKFGNKEVQQYTKGLRERWTTAGYTEQEKERFIVQTNIMLLKNYQMNPELLNYAKTFELIKSDSAVATIPSQDFFTASDSCILLLNRKQTAKFYAGIRNYAGIGAAFKTSNASWKFSQTDPKLLFGTFANEELGKKVSFPYLEFTNTNLVYSNPSDTTIIYSTKGRFNMMNRMFDGDGGRIDWAKMDLPPDDVYAELIDYGLNLNYSFVKIDTVLFHYNSLLGGKVLKGKFEDINRGYRNINKANYPYFRSYEGGVVIENLIPGVRYEGGFSLRGIRKIGSAYFDWVEIEEEEIPVNEDLDEEDMDSDGGEPDDFSAVDELGYEYDNSAFFFSDDELDGSSDEEDPFAFDEEDYETDSDTETDLSGSDFEAIDEDFMPYSNKERRLMKATLTLNHKDRKTMALRALEFVLDLEKLVSRRTEVSLYISDEDSITHPSVDVVYNVDSSEVVLYKDVKDKKAHQAFLSPYHNYYLYFDAIRWNLKTDVIEFTSLIDKENQSSAIESYDYFALTRFRQAKGVMRFNPVGAINRYMHKYPGTPILPEDICNEYNLPDELPKLMLALPEIEGMGYIQYNEETREIKPLPKLETWSMAALGKKDYDAISIISQVKSGNNAELDLNDREINLEGVEFFTLSDSQYVAAVPNQDHVTVRENRDLNFNGVMAAGKLNFYGVISPEGAPRDTTEGKFTFEYENYKIKCDSLDSLRFILIRNPEVGYNFTKLQKALRNTTIEGVTGAIYINKPYNKNGLEAHPEYPVFDSYTKSYVYWAKPNVRGGVYTKDKLHFDIDPFVLDSLEDFDEKSLSFEGEFFSSEILPPIKQKLSVMEDYTLGFKQVAPPDTGYGLYDGKGRLSSGEVQLDGSGLTTNGTMEFMQTTARSDSFQMFFDSVKAITNDFELPRHTEDGAKYPDIKAGTIAYKWLTKKDQIELQTVENGEPIQLFGGEGLFEGKLIVTKEGLKGSGKLTLGNVTVESEEIDFNEMDFSATKGTFTVYDKNNPGKELYVATDMDISYDVDKHTSEFQSEKVGEATSNFPEQSFMTSLGKGKYNKEKNDLRLESLSVKPKDNYFYSTDKMQDSLNFRANTAYYNFDQKEIDIKGVPYIYVADAKITPDSTSDGAVTVKTDGYLQKLTDAVIDANLETNYHHIYAADIEIKSSKNYDAKGKYDYIEIGGKDQFINMTEIKVQADTLTIAKGSIEEEQGFYLTDRIFFKGETFLKANREYMRFTGEVKIESDNEAFSNWIPFDTIVNPDSVFIKIDVSESQIAGLHYIKQNRVFYSTFLQPKKSKEDLLVASAKGGLTYDRNTNEFRIGPAKKLQGVENRGTTSALDDQNNIITTIGKLDIPFKWEKNTINSEVAGRWKDDMGNREVTANLMLRLTMDCISKEAWAKMAERVKLQASLDPDIQDIDFKDPLFLQSISEFLDPNYKQEEKATKELVKTVENAEVPANDVKVAKELGGSLFLTDIAMRFDPEYKTLFSTSGDIGVLGINGEPINKKASFSSKVEYNLGRYTPQGLRLSDTLKIYIEIDEFTWYYFKFAGDVVYTWSSDVEGYIAQLESELEKRKKSDGYRFELATEEEMQDFLNRFTSRYIWRE